MAWLPHHFVIATHTAGSQMLLDCATSTQRPWLHCLLQPGQRLQLPQTKAKEIDELASVLPLGATPF